MAKILGIGIATLDIINIVNAFPEEDSEVRALGQTTARGGNVTNSLVLLSQLGHQTYWAGTIADENDANIIVSDLNKYNVNSQYVTHYPNGKTPTSYILLNQSNGSRSIVHYRDLPELDFQTFKNIPLEDFDWIHFEARNIDQTIKMIRFLKQHHPDIPCSVEFEKQRTDIEKLCPFADILIFSKGYCQNSQQPDPAQFLTTLGNRYKNKTLILAWGEKGSYALAADNQLLHTPACRPANTRDTLGAGDTFNAGIIDALIQGLTIDKALSSANKLAAFKISVSGFDIADYER